MTFEAVIGRCKDRIAITYYTICALISGFRDRYKEFKRREQRSLSEFRDRYKKEFGDQKVVGKPLPFRKLTPEELRAPTFLAKDVKPWVPINFESDDTADLPTPAHKKDTHGSL